ncbi:uncharacterized protein BJ171DRAFT_443338 [Polychytrium aggregatum]|uniref:uncharacterized protein n=1 Tax=Polychytrium aggregatum TaxID=110093 RepID=UPI0022FEFFC8|nr:uncharacterized protein BJ171DRAFT_443338 [Polychytrium aggregatum]KAI9203426.1 hypothetical protein BJ171DRAFT_443338 [Polychytrium aggregatum]
MSFAPIQRPQADEDEDDLLLLQEQFLQSKDARAPAATVVRAAPPRIASKTTPLERQTADTSSASEASRSAPMPPQPSPAIVDAVPAKKSVSFAPDPERDVVALSSSGASRPAGPATPTKKRVSLFAARRQQQRESQADSDRAPSKTIENADETLAHVFHTVTERSPAEADVVPPIFNAPKTGFPEVLHRSQVSESLHRTSRPAENQRNQSHAIKSMFQTSAEYTLDQDINAENVGRLESMSADEIEAARASILEKLDPKIVELLTKRAQKRYTEDEPSATSGDDGTRTVAAAIPSQSESGIEDPSTTAMTNKPSDDLLDVPEGKLEVDKLEWLRDTPSYTSKATVSPTEDSSQLRFNFSGALIEDAASVPVHLGLHHHGDSPEQAGYTISELMLLSRSTVPSQRVIALRTLNSIVVNMKSAAYDNATRSLIGDSLIELRFAVNIRIALDDTNETVLLASLRTLVSYLGASDAPTEALFASDSTSEDIWDTTLLTRCGYRVLALSPDSMSGFAARSKGIRQPQLATDQMSGGEQLPVVVDRLMEKDIILALLETNILVRFKFLLETQKLPLTGVRYILACIGAFVRHSYGAAKAVADSKDLLEVIRKRFIESEWPAPAGDKASSIPAAIKVFRLLCLTSRVFATSVASSGLGESLMRFIAIHPAKLSPALRSLGFHLMAESLGLAGALFAYGIGARLFADYRTVFFELVKSTLSEPAQSESETTYDLQRFHQSRCAVLALKTLSEYTFSFFNLVSDPMSTDTLQPFVHIVSASLSDGGTASLKSDPLDVLVRTAKLDFLRSYAQKFDSSSVFPGFVTAMLDAIELKHGTKSKLYTAVSSRILDTPASSADLPQRHHAFRLHSDLQDRSEIEYARNHLRQSIYYDGASAFLEFAQTLARLDAHAQAMFLWFTTEASNKALLKLSAKQSSRPEALAGWQRMFGRGRVDFIYRYISALLLVHPLSAFTKDEAVFVYETSLALVAEFLPGDEYPASRLLSSVVMHPEWQHVALGRPMPLDEQDELKRRKLHDVYDYNLYEDDALVESKAFYQHLGDQMVSFMLETAGRAQYQGLPAPDNWLYSVVETVSDEGAAAGQAREDSGDLIVESLVFTEHLDSALPRWTRVAGLQNSFAKLFKVFVLPPMSTDGMPSSEIFMSESVSSALDKALDRWCRLSNDASGTDGHDLDKLMGGRGRFYQLYQGVLEQYCASSFGDPVFSRYIVLPLSMLYPADYRILFWQELVEHVPSFPLTISRVPRLAMAPDNSQTGREYLYPIETELAVLSLYAKRLAVGSVSKTRSPFLYWLAVHHLSGFLFSDPPPDRAALRKLIGSPREGPRQLPEEVVAELLNYNPDCISVWTDSVPAASRADDGEAWSHIAERRRQLWLSNFGANSV